MSRRCPGYLEYGFCSRNNCRYDHGREYVTVPEMEFLCDWEFNFPSVSHGMIVRPQYVPKYTIPSSNVGYNISGLPPVQDTPMNSYGQNLSVEGGVGIKRQRVNSNEEYELKRVKKENEIDLILPVQNKTLSLVEKKEQRKKRMQMRKAKYEQELREKEERLKKISGEDEIIIKRKSAKLKKQKEDDEKYQKLQEINRQVERQKEHMKTATVDQKKLYMKFENVDFDNPKIAYHGPNELIARDFRQNSLKLIRNMYKRLYPTNKKMGVMKSLQSESEIFSKYRRSGQKVYWNQVCLLIKNLKKILKEKGKKL